MNLIWLVVVVIATPTLRIPVQVTVNIQLQNLPFPVDDLVILPRQRFILDRTKCVPFISFPGKLRSCGEIAFVIWKFTTLFSHLLFFSSRLPKLIAQPLTAVWG